jgi:hypothetical protein
MPFQIQHELFQEAERLSRKADCTAKKNRVARAKNNLIAAEAHEATANAYYAQTTDDWAGGSYLPHVTTRKMGEIYGKAHKDRANGHRKAAKEA